MIPYTLIRSRRKSIALRVIEGALEVRAPHHVSRQYIENLILEKEMWIKQHVDASAALKEERDEHTLHYGDTVPYMGTAYTIEARYDRYLGWDRDHRIFYVPSDLNASQIRRDCIHIYRLLGQVDLTLKAIHWACKMDVKFKEVKISNAKNRWGSCSSSGNLNFSWRLLLADEALIDYIVVHELAHLKEMNHQAAFWAIVRGVLPDYKEREAQLKAFRETIYKEGW